MQKYNSLSYRYYTKHKKFLFMFDNSKKLVKAIGEVVGQSAVKYMMIDIKPNSFVIKEFFLLELEFAISELLDKRADLLLHINSFLLLTLKKFLRNETWLKGKFEKTIPLNFESIKSQLKFKPLPNQIQAFKKYEFIRRMGNLRGFVLDAAPGTGKALRHGSKVKTLRGFVKIEDLTLDDKVLSIDNKYKDIIGIFPQGERKIYKITFEDGRTTECDVSHLWEINRDREIVSTFNIIKRLMDKEVIYIPLKELDGALDLRSYKLKGNVAITDKKGSKALRNNVNRIGSKCYVIKNNDDKYEVDLSPYFDNERFLRIVNVEFTCKDEATCIAVKGKRKLFIIDDYIVTHNTYMSLGLKEMFNKEHCLIIAPKSTIDEVWVKSVSETIYKIPKNYKVLGRRSDRNVKSPMFYITHYEYLVKILEDKKLLSELRKLNPFVIVDEYHNFNETKAQRTSFLVELINTLKIEDMVMMSGTPIKLNKNELLPLLSILDNKFYDVEDDFKAFYNYSRSLEHNFIQLRFNVYRDRIETDTTLLPEIKVETLELELDNGDEYTIENINDKMLTYRNERLKEILSNEDSTIQHFDILYNRIEVAKIKQKIPLEQIKKEKRKHETMITKIRNRADENKLFLIYDKVAFCKEFEKEHVLKWLDGDDKKNMRSILSMLKYPTLKVLGEALGRVLLRSRIDCYKDLANKLDYKQNLSLTDKKTIIFSNYTEATDIAFINSIKAGYEPVRAYGDYKSDLANDVKAFNDLNTKVNPIIATYKSLSTGVPLIGGNIIICLDVIIKSYIFSQAVARAHRLGQNKNVTVIMVKLKTEEPNITDRDGELLSISKFNVKYITGNDEVYDLPSNVLFDRDEDDELEEEDQNLADSEILDEIQQGFLEVNGSHTDFSSIVRKFFTKILR